MGGNVQGISLERLLFRESFPELGEKLGKDSWHRMPQREWLKCTQTGKSKCKLAVGKVITGETEGEDGTKFKE